MPIDASVFDFVSGWGGAGRAGATATGVTGALAGIIVRNSILLVDFINLEVAAGKPVKQAVAIAYSVKREAAKPMKKK